jgi:uncharacterized membrane protein
MGAEKGMDNQDLTAESLPEEAPTPAIEESAGSSRKILIGLIVSVVVVLALIILGIYALTLPTTDTARVRDIFIIFMALESLLLGFVLIILIIQIARLTNLLQNEVKPILESTNETVNTLRGTTAFLSDNLAQPVIKLNEYLAALTKTMALIGLARKRDKK